MVLEIVLYTLGIYMIAKSLLVLIFKKPVISLATRLLKNKKSINRMAILEVILGIILLALGYLVV
jgi:hypothetical protein